MANVPPSTDTADEPELTDLKWIGDSMAENLADVGVESAEDLLYANKYELASMNGVGIDKAETMIQSAHDAFNNAWENKQFDPQTQEYYDAGPSEFVCVCERKFDDETTFKVHVKRCNVAGGEPPMYAFTNTVHRDDGCIEIYGDGDPEHGFPIATLTEQQAMDLADLLVTTYDLVDRFDYGVDETDDTDTE